MKGFFITGTDTGVGKTWVATALLHRLGHTGLRCAGMKPVAAGCSHTADGWRNEDALQLLAHSNVRLAYDDVNPCALPAAIAPHLAAHEVGTNISVERLHAAYVRLMAFADCVIVEGAGGWRVPLNHRETLADLAIRIDLPVILVVGMRLGCLNHALLTAEAVAQSGLRLSGWVANCIDPVMEKVAENIETLEKWLGAPRIAHVAHLPTANTGEIAAMFNLDALT